MTRTLLCTAALAAAACGNNPRTSTETAALLGGPLPVRSFRQVDATLTGAHELGPIDVTAGEPGQPDGDGDLVAEITGPARYELWVRERDGARTLLWPATDAHYPLGGPVSFVTASRRVVCGSFGAVIDHGMGPLGLVLGYDRSVGMVVQCWHAARPDGAWTAVTVAGSAGERVALWLGMADADPELVDTAAVYYTRDAEYDDRLLTPYGRVATDGIYEVTMTFSGDGVSLAVTDHEPNVAALLPMFQADAMSCEGRCGWISNGVLWQDCGATCAEAESCGPENVCIAEACAPATEEEVCLEKLGAAPCGYRSDGCGGRVACAACPGGQTCGAAGITTHCGQRINPASIDDVRARYRDQAGILCGILDDPLTGVPVVMDTVCAAGTSCEGNLCQAGTGDDPPPTDDPPPLDDPAGDDPAGDDPPADDPPPTDDPPPMDDPPGDDPPGDDLPPTEDPPPPADDPPGDLPGGDPPPTDDPPGDMPEGDPPGDMPGDDPPGGDMPGGDMPGGDMPGGDMPGGDMPGGDMPGGDMPGGDMPGGDMPGGDEMPGGDMPGDDAPASEWRNYEWPSYDMPWVPWD